MVEIEDGYVTGVADIMVPDGDKVGVGIDLMEQLGVAPDQVAFIGDSEADAELVGLVGLGVAYNSSSSLLVESADYVLEKGEMIELIEIIGSHVKEATDDPHTK